MGIAGEKERLVSGREFGLYKELEKGNGRKRRGLEEREET